MSTNEVVPGARINHPINHQSKKIRGRSMSSIISNIKINEVHEVKFPGIGNVYSGKVQIGTLFRLLKNGAIRYAPKYQRGFKPQVDEDYDKETLRDIYHEGLMIDEKRSNEMAVKYLMALNGDQKKMLYNPEIVWNARVEEGVEKPKYDQDSKVLLISGQLSIPDSAHRHYAYYTLCKWKFGNKDVPREVRINEDGETKSREEVESYLRAFDPNHPDDAFVMVKVYTLTASQEGRLFDEYNTEGKKPSKSSSIDMYSDKTASRRFLNLLEAECKIFGGKHIERKSNSIAKHSGKLTTLSTLDSSIQPFNDQLRELESDQARYNDLIEFVSAFWEEWAANFKPFQPNATGKERDEFRNMSFAMSNIMFFPLFRIAFELWHYVYNAKGKDWRQDPQWKDGLARLAADVDVPGKTIKVPFMARDHKETSTQGNPSWQGKILIQKFNQDGSSNGWSLSSTRQTREAAYHHIIRQAGLVDTLMDAKA